MKHSQERTSIEVAAALLPAAISSIHVQKKNKNRFSIFVDEEFLVGVSDSTLISLNLKKGDVLTTSKLERIFSLEDQWALKTYFLRLLSRRDHSKKELKNKALQKGYRSAQIEGILNELSEKGYINNLEFAMSFTRDKFRFNRWGVNKIRVELRKKGVSEKEISTALSQVDTVCQSESIQELINKHKARFLRVIPEKRKKKVYDFLLRKGYDSSIISSNLTSLLDSIENEKHHA